MGKLSNMGANVVCKRWLIAALCAAVTACDGDDPALPSGVAGSKHLADLSKSEVQRICVAARAFVDESVPAELVAMSNCTSKAREAGDADACRAAMRRCIDRPDGGTDAGAAGSASRDIFHCETREEVAGCEATVDELEHCIRDAFTAESRALKATSCDTLDGGPGEAVAAKPSPACVSLWSKCPDLPDFARPIVVPDDPESIGVLFPASCTDLDMHFDGNDCTASGCKKSVRCDCDGMTMLSSACNGLLGCLSEVDCDAACTRTPAFVKSCVEQYECEQDSDCGDYFCYSPTGQCSRGEPGDACEDDQDCANRHCVGDPDSKSCSLDVATGGFCTSDLQCASDICYLDPSVDAHRCSDGRIGDACAAADDCQDQMCVYVGSGYVCSDGWTGSPCSNDSHCNSGRCASASSVCVDGAPGDPCDDSADCLTGECVVPLSSSEKSCSFEPGQECPLGIADCRGDCRVAQASCDDAACTPTCGSGGCSSRTFATWSETDHAPSVMLADGDLTASATDSLVAVRATIGERSGRWYWEVYASSASVSGQAAIGVLTEGAALDVGLATSTSTGAAYPVTGMLSSSSGDTASACSFMDGDRIGVALDLDAHRIYFSLNGVWQNGADPVARSGGLPLDVVSEQVFPAVSLDTGDMLRANFGQTTFAHAPPRGFEALAK